MLKTLQLTIILVAMALMGCSDDEGPSPDGNGFTYETGFVPTTESAFVIHDVGNVCALFLDEGATFNSSTEQYEGDFVNVVNIDLETSLPNDVATGTYTFDATQSQPNSFFGQVFLAFDLFTGEGFIFDIVDGQVQVQNNGATYEFSYDLTLSNNVKVTGSYFGTIDRVIQ